MLRALSRRSHCTLTMPAHQNDKCHVGVDGCAKCRARGERCGHVMPQARAYDLRVHAMMARLNQVMAPFEEAHARELRNAGAM